VSGPVALLSTVIGVDAPPLVTASSCLEALTNALASSVFEMSV
jgi:hypothetical protein